MRVILDQLSKVVEYTGAFVLTLEADSLRVVDYRGPVATEQLVGTLFPLEHAVVYQEVLRRGQAPVIVSDLRRSWLAAAGLWIVSFPLGFHAVSRHDGVVSVMRGFTPRELVDTVHEAVARRPRARRRRGFRVTTNWVPVH